MSLLKRKLSYELNCVFHHLVSCNISIGHVLTSKFSRHARLKPPIYTLIWRSKQRALNIAQLWLILLEEEAAKSSLNAYLFIGYETLQLLTIDSYEVRKIRDVVWNLLLHLISIHPCHVLVVMAVLKFNQKNQKKQKTSQTSQTYYCAIFETLQISNKTCFVADIFRQMWWNPL